MEEQGGRGGAGAVLTRFRERNACAEKRENRHGSVAVFAERRMAGIAGARGYSNEERPIPSIGMRNRRPSFSTLRLRPLS